MLPSVRALLLSFRHGILAAILAVPALASADEPDDPSLLTLERIYGSNEFASESYSARWVDAGWPGDGASYTRLEAAPGPSGGRDIVRVDARTGEKKILVPAVHLVPPGDTRALAIEDYRFSEDRSLLLVYTNSKRVWRRNTRGDYWVLDRSSRELRKLGGDAASSTLMFAKLSPTGRHAAYVRANDIWVEDLRTGEITNVTGSGSDTVINGTFDWVYEEELGLRDGFRWRPDGSAIAYWQIDSEGVRQVPLVNNIDALYPTVMNIRYPKVGEMNSACRVGVVGVGGGETKWLDVPGDPRNHYIARMDWVVDDAIIIQQLNRLQNTNRVLIKESHEGIRNVFTDRDDAWLRAVDELEWLVGRKHFTWISERDGWRHVWVVSRVDGKARCATPGDFDVIKLLRAEQVKGPEYGYLWFIASPDNPTQKYLYRCRLDGSELERVTPDDAPGIHSYDISPDAKYAIHTYSRHDAPPVIDLVTLPDHRRIRVLAANEKLRKRFDELAKEPTEFFRIDIGGGVELDGWCMKPPGYDPQKKYPLLVYVYGEPAGQTALDRWGGSSYLWHLMLTQRGYVVMNFDNRGTPAPRGREWRKIVYRQVGILAPKEQAAAVRKVRKERPWIDPERVGVWGWSGGGSMTLNAMFKHPDLYHVGMCIAPVPNQRFYDTIYQERYMGLPSTNVEGFYEGSPIHFAKNLKGNLLLIHGTGDDNCHYQGTEALVDELIRHDKQFSMMAYPNRTHSIRERANTTPHLRALLTRYLMENLPAGARERDDPTAASGTVVPESGENDKKQRPHTERDIEGWKVQVDDKLLGGEGAEVGRKALKILAHELHEIVHRVPADKLAKLRKVPIWIDLDHELRSMQYHPGVGWLQRHGYDPRMVKSVHIPRAKSLINLHRTYHQPWVVLHELAHAYHDRELGFNEPEIMAAYKRVVDAKIYESVLINRGNKARHYALTDQKEFFAEMTESYFGTNDFYPFVKRELREVDPQTHALLEKVWGKVP